MIKKITRKVMKEVEEVVSSVGICDICGKEFNYEPWLGKGKMANYYHIRTGHYDWGNDSCESVESRDACCDECLSRFTQDWLKDKDVIRSKTAYIEINKDSHVLKETNAEYIDNAPTVVNEYTKGFADGERSGRHFPLTDEEKAILIRQWRTKGEWIAREDMDYLDENKVVHNHFECNKCGLIHDFIDGHTSQYNFCPNCGADMRGKDE